MKAHTKESEKTVFAYIRKSTDREDKQVHSLERQREEIMLIAKAYAIQESAIQFFVESESAYSTGRKVFTKMLKELDKGKPKILIAYHVNRLSRNSTDGEALENRIKGKDGHKKSIEKIITLGGISDEKTPTIMFSFYWGQGKQESENLSNVVTSSMQRMMNDGQFCFSTPRGIKMRVNSLGVRVLYCTDEMRGIRRAFELRAEGNSYKDIAQILLEEEDFVVSNYRSIANYLSKSLYIGEYTSKQTGEILTFQFEEGYPPISRTLWDRVRHQEDPKRPNYGESGEDFELLDILKTPNKNVFSPEIKKGRYKYYRNPREKINIAENKILLLFIDGLVKMIQGLVELRFNDMLHEFKIEEERLTELSEVAHLSDEGYHNFMVFLMKSKKFYRRPKAVEHILEQIMIMKIITKRRESLTHSPEDKQASGLLNGIGAKMILEKSDKNSPEIKLELDRVGLLQSLKMGDAVMKEMLTVFQNQILEQTKELREQKQKRLLLLEKQRMKLLDRKKQVRDYLFDKTISKKDYQEETDDIESKLGKIDEDLQSFHSSENGEDFYDRLPEVLVKMFELVDNAVLKGKSETIEERKEQIIKLLKMVVFELSVTSEKELKIQFFPLIDSFFSNDLFNGDPMENRTPIAGMRILCPSR